MSNRPKAKLADSPWNKDRALGQMAPFVPADIALIREELLAQEKTRDLALFNVGIDTMLRASDLLPLSVRDVTDHRGLVVEEVRIRQQKTGHGHLVVLAAHTREALAQWILLSGKQPSDYLWTSIGNRKTGKPLTREHYANLVKSWCKLVRVDPTRHSTHTMRRSKAVAIYELTQNLAALQHLLGHKSIASTAHYLGVDQRKALDLAKQIKI
ncbi:MAG: tyrosine-type recombinase/integrase [Pseudomonadota bacterium]